MIGQASKLRWLYALVAVALLSLSGQRVLAAGEAQPLLSFRRGAQAVQPQEAQQPVRVDSQVQLAGVEAAAPTVGALPAASKYALPPPSQKASGPMVSGKQRRSPAFALPRIESLSTAVTGLGIVVGLFLVCMFLLRKTGPKPTSPLPKEAVSVLGRMPLAPRNFAQLLHVGNKLVLVSVTPEGVSPITEVTDPAEVDRLMGVCLRNHKQSTTAEFQHVLEKLSQEPASGFLGNEATAAYSQQKR